MKTELLTTEIRSEDDLVLVRQRTRQIAEALGLTTLDQTRLATAVSEVARNAFQYAAPGRATFGIDEDPAAFVVRVTDKGPGIADVDSVLNGHTKRPTSGFGKGISGARQLTDRFQMVSAPGAGTAVELAMRLPRTAPALSPTLLGRLAEELVRRTPSPMEEVRYQNQELLQALEDARLAAAVRQEQLDFTWAMADSLGEGVVAVDLDGNVTFYNQAAERLLGREGKTTLAAHLEELIQFASGDGGPIRCPLTGVLRTGVRIASDEHLLKRTDGSWFPAAYTCAPIRRAEATTGAVIVFQDISDRKQAEQERKGMIEGLQQTARFNELFVGVLGHDLRNPLNAIAMAAHVLLRRPDSAPASRIISSATRMGRMIDQILDFTRLRLGTGVPLRRRKVDLGELLHAIVEEFQGEGSTQQIESECAGDLAGTWDGDRLAQVLSNLLGNARHHGVSEKPISVAIDGRSPDFVVVKVKNSGTIPPELLPVIFEPLRMGRTEHSRSQGLGLGLFITQQVAAAHGGSIEVESDDASGTTFSLRLPRKPPPDRKSEAAGQDQHATS